MNTASTTVDVGAKLSDAIELMAANEHSCAIVVDKSNHAVGVVTERDILKLVAKKNGKVGGLNIRDVMSSPPLTLLPSATLQEALNLSRARKLRHLLIVDENRELRGIVTQTDMVRAYLEQLNQYQRELEEAVNSRTLALEMKNQKLLDLAMEDSLTKVGNRRAMEIDLKHTQNSARRYGENYEVALLDIDWFKKYNDQYGHQAGDHVLIRVAQVIKKSLRDSDRLYRYGGEEFLLLLPKVSSHQATKIVNRTRINIFEEKIEHEQSPYQFITVSGGVASGSETDWRQSVKSADAALYKAKEGGRNTVVTATEI